MFKILNILNIGNIYCVSVEGDIQLLRNGLQLHDENGNIFEIETVAMPHYHKRENYKKYAEIVLIGDIEKIGKTLFLIQ